MDVVPGDILVIGAGGAGLRAAISIAETSSSLAVSLLSKVYPMRSHTVAAEGGAAGVIKDNDSLDDHFHDTVAGGDWLSDQDAVELFVKTAPLELTQIEHWGCPWSRESSGRVAVRPFGGMKIERTWYAADKTGFHMLHTLFQTSLKFPSIRRFDEFYVTDLLVDDGRCVGAAAIEIRSGRMMAFVARAVIIAGGGAGRSSRSPRMVRSKPVTGWRWPIVPACRSRTWNSSSTIPPVCREPASLLPRARAVRAESLLTRMAIDTSRITISGPLIHGRERRRWNWGRETG